jgi:hypothetical protein
VSVDALLVKCPYCKSRVREVCTRYGWTKRVPCQGPHPSRVRAAALAEGYDEQAAAGMASEVVAGMVERYREVHPSSADTVEESATVVE